MSFASKPPRHTRVETKMPAPVTEQLASLRESDKIPYLEIDSFKERFPLHEEAPLGEGSSGSVFASGDKYAVKRYPYDNQYIDLITELNIYASAIHPCILRPYAWSVDNGIGYLAMRRASSISSAYREGLITMEQIIFDSLSAVTFLNHQGIAHCDIKPANLVYCKGRCMLIDMGLAKFAEMHADGDYYLTGKAYTLAYKDLEYVDEQYNNIKTEIFGLAASYIHLLEGRPPQLGEVYTYQSKQPELAWFFQEAALLLDQRRKIGFLLDHAALNFSLPKRVGLILTESTSVSYTDKHMAVVMGWLVTVSYHHSHKAETLFLALHLIHRAYAKVVASYTAEASDQVETRRITKSIIQLLGCVALNLATIIVSGEKVFSIEIWQQLAKDTEADYLLRFQRMNIVLLEALGGIISTQTYWHYAKSREDLLPLLRDTLRWRYDPVTTIRPLSGAGASKCVLVRDFLDSASLEQLRRTPLEVSFMEKVPAGIPMLRPCLLPIGVEASFITSSWREYKAEPGNVTKAISFLAALLHNRQLVNQVGPRLLDEIISFLLQEAAENPIMTFVLNKVFRNSPGNMKLNKASRKENHYASLKDLPSITPPLGETPPMFRLLDSLPDSAELATAIRKAGIRR